MDVITGDKKIKAFHLLQLKAAIKLQKLGMKHSSGKSVLAYAKRTYGFAGNADDVISQIEDKLRELNEEIENGR